MEPKNEIKLLDEIDTSIVLDDLMRMSVKMPTEDFIIKDLENVIKKSVFIKRENNMGIESIELHSLPEHIQSITLSFGKKNIFVQNREDLSKYRNKNLLTKYQIKDLIPTFIYCYDEIKVNYIYDAEKIYEQCEINTQEVITKIAVEDTDKEVEYWDMDDDCSRNAYGVKYIEEKSEKRMITKSPTLQTPLLKIIYKKFLYDKNKIYKIPFYDENMGCKNNLIVTNGNTYNVEL